MLGHDEAAALVEGQLFEAEELLGAHFAVAVVLLVVVIAVFRRLEPRMSDFV